MKRFCILALVLFGIAALVAPPQARAQNFPAYQTGFQVMNLGSGPAGITVSYYRVDDGAPGAGILLDQLTDTIAVGASKTYFPALAAFRGSVVVASSSQPVAAVTNILNGAGTAGASYVGARVPPYSAALPLVLSPPAGPGMVGRGEAAFTPGRAPVASNAAGDAFLPLLMKGNGGFDTWFSVQNLSSSQAEVTIRYSDIGCPPITTTIAPNASKPFYNALEGCHTQKTFSATVSSLRPVAVVALEENANTIFAYTGFNPEAASPTPVIPLVNANNSGYSTGIQIQNTSATATDVTVSYVPSGPNSGTACTEKQTIPGNQSRTFAFVALQQANVAGITTNCPVGAKLVGSARVTANTANVPLVAIVNQLSGVPNGGAYAAFNPGNATPKVVLPLLMDRNGGYYTGFSVMNVGSAATFVRCTLTGAAAAGYIPAQQLAPGAGMTAVQGGQVGEKYVGSGTCIAYTNANYTTVDTNARIVAVVNELGPARSDQLLVYEGINVQP